MNLQRGESEDPLVRIPKYALHTFYGSMNNTLFVVFSITGAFCLAASMRSGPQLTAAGGTAGKRTRRDVACEEDLEYLHDNICCLNCPAGKYVKSPCSSPGQKGRCEACDFDTHTEHSNGLRQCLKCTKCRLDQDMVRICTSTQNAECQCKPGLFCTPDQACEVCKRCSRCREDEVKVGNCTSTSDTTCVKQLPHSHTSVVTGLLSVLFAVMLTAVGIFVCWKRRKRSTTGPESNPDEMLKVVVDDMANHSLEERQNSRNQTVDDSRLRLLPLRVQQAVSVKAFAREDDDDTGLGDSLPTSASNSQHSLSGQPSAPLPTSTPQRSPVSHGQHSTREYEPLPRLVALKDDESLRRCFEYFEEMDFDYHNRFFRAIGLHDNVIKSRDPLSHEDRVHELLNVWMEKVGKEASLNHLLRALLALNQRLTAENIFHRAIVDGHYKPEEGEVP